MLIEGLGRSIHADREREIEERLRQRGLVEDALEAILTGTWQGAPADPHFAAPAGDRAAVDPSRGMPALGRPR